MYEILIEQRAEKNLLKIPRAIVERIIKHIICLRDNPRLYGTRKIIGNKDDWRMRIGDYRVVYEIQDDNKIIRIFRIKHRKDAYK